MKLLSSLLLVSICLSVTACSDKTAQETTSSQFPTPPSDSATGWDGGNWMGILPDKTPLYDITIPGTHDSGATRSNFLGGAGQCQSLSIANQLSCGVRFFDIRLKLKGDSLDVYHGFIDQKLTFQSVRTACKEFLTAHPNEVILLCIKEEDDDNDGFAKAVENAIQEDAGWWYTKNALPTLGEARGKIILFRRFDGSTLGINCRNGWADNTDFTMENGGTIQVQDYYNLESTKNIDTKWKKFTAHASKANRTDALCINFASGYTGLANITSVSDQMNPKLTEYFATKKGSYGTILCDFITPELAALLIATNF